MEQEWLLPQRKSETAFGHLLELGPVASPPQQEGSNKSYRREEKTAAPKEMKRLHAGPSPQHMRAPKLLAVHNDTAPAD